MRLIKQSDYNVIDKSYPKCQQAIKLCGNLHLTNCIYHLNPTLFLTSSVCYAKFLGTDGGSACMAAYLVCTSIFNKIMNVVGNKNVRKHNFFYFSLRGNSMVTRITPISNHNIT